VTDAGDQAARLADVTAKARALADARLEMDRVADQLDSTVAALLAAGAPPAALLDRVLALLGDVPDTPALRRLYPDGPPPARVLQRFVPDHPPAD
jgi:hypothetical protein